MEITVPGMSCAPCARAVTNAVHEVDQDATITIDMASKRVAIATAATPEQIVEAIEDAGYKVDRPNEEWSISAVRAPHYSL